MATHSSVLAWRIPGIVEPGGLSSMPVCSIGTLHVLTGFAPGFISSACLTLNSVIAGTHCLQKLLPALLVTWCLMTLSTGGGGNQIHNG